MPTLPPETVMDKAFRTRDAEFDGVFFLGVTTTGVFCKPSCPARKPLAEHVRYFATAREALFSGFRPCKRCRPMEADGRPPAWIRTLLDTVEKDPARRITDGDLRAMGFDPVKVRRYFLRHYGMTFHAYARGRRLGLALDDIRRGEGLDGVVFDHGYESHSGFRDAFSKTFGRTPGTSRATGCILAAWLESPLGPLVAGATEEGVCLLEFTDRRMLETQFRTVQKRLGRSIVPGRNEHLDRLREEVGAYFSGSLRRFTVPLVYPGTPFQSSVWDELLRIPYGETRSYENLARAVGRPGASRAVGTANGCNRIAIVIPCHRVVNKNGKLGGYGGGLWRKQRLLELEQGCV